MELLFPSVMFVCACYVVAVLLLFVRAYEAIDRNVNRGCRMASSVELVGFKGLEPALAPGAISPVFSLLVRVHNGHVYDQYRDGDGGGVTVSYAGIPLAHGRTPSFRVGANSAVTFTVNATTQAVGVPEELFRLMSAERRWGAAQLEVGMQLGWPGWESFAWRLGALIWMGSRMVR
ncbi:hypothetical protein ACP70R_038193 [Stipagrostis hirtigluma subsp. patula]